MSAEHHSSLLDAVKGQPKQVWITAFAAVIAFMGIGLVDPILLSIAKGLDATPSQVTLLFSSYLGVQVVAMLVHATHEVFEIGEVGHFHVLLVAELLDHPLDR